MITALEFYSGIGGMRCALASVDPGAVVMRAMDINPAANQVYTHNFLEHPAQVGPTDEFEPCAAASRMVDHIHEFEVCYVAYRSTWSTSVQGSWICTQLSCGCWRLPANLSLGKGTRKVLRILAAAASYTSSGSCRTCKTHPNGSYLRMLWGSRRLTCTSCCSNP